MSDSRVETAVPVRPGNRQRLRLEILILLGLSLGQSAVYSVVQLAQKMSLAPLAQGTSTLNTVQSSSEYFDFTYQLLGIFFALVPVFLAFYLLWRPGVSTFRSLGLDWRHPWRDAGSSLALLVVIGLPSLGLYAVGRALGVTTEIIPSALNSYWWTMPVLVISAIREGIVEETIMVGYLLNRFGKLGWSPIWAAVVSSLIRGSYHLYQGFGPFVGNFLMGLLFCWVYKKFGRLAPLVVTHALLDIAAFTAGPLLGFG